MLLERGITANAEAQEVSPATEFADPILRGVPVVEAAASHAFAPTRYGGGKAVSGRSLAITVAIHGLVVALLLGLNHQATVEKKTRLTVVELSPPPAPPQAPQPPEPQKPEMRVERPKIELTRPQQYIVPVALEDPPKEVVEIQTAVAAPLAPPAPPAPPSIITSNQLGAQMISASPPRYPIESRRHKEQGTVELLLILGTDGRVESISVNRSSGFSRLDNAALSAVRKWRWAPIVRNGSPVKVQGIVEIPFVLQGAG